ncbi:MAG: phosphoribosyltransferase [Myxococcota bacterium]
MQHVKPTRAPWGSLPDVVIEAAIPPVKGHPDYAAAKAGDADAAVRLVAATFDQTTVAVLGSWAGQRPVILLPVHALEETGVNAIPLAFAEELGRRLGWPVSTGVVQTNVVGHTGASGYARLARQALFEGEVEPGADHVLVDDFIGQGGTLANLRGHVLAARGGVVGAAVLTGKLHSAKLALSPETLDELRRKHGPDLEGWWRDRFGHAFDCLTESEARYLARTPDAQRIRDQLAEEEREGDRGED